MDKELISLYVKVIKFYNEGNSFKKVSLKFNIGITTVGKLINGKLLKKEAVEARKKANPIKRERASIDPQKVAALHKYRAKNPNVSFTILTEMFEMTRSSVDQILKGEALWYLHPLAKGKSYIEFQKIISDKESK